MNIYEYFQEPCTRHLKFNVVCNDGFTCSVQNSPFLFTIKTGLDKPNDVFEYKALELSEEATQFDDYDRHCVPIGAADRLFASHGGLACVETVKRSHGMWSDKEEK